MRDTFSPVKKPGTPSLIIIYLKASVTPLYSENPTTSNLVLTTIRGLEIMERNIRDVEPAMNALCILNNYFEI